MIELSYFDFVQKIRSFKRSTVLQFASNLGWAAWEKWKDYEIESRTGNELYLIRAHAGRIAAISAATGSEDRVKEASPKIIQQPCHDYISIKEPLVDDNLFTKLDFLPLKKYLETSE